MTREVKGIRTALGGLGERSLGATWIEKSAHGGNPIGGEAYAPRVFLDRRLVRSKVHAVHLVVGYVAMEPLDSRHSLQYVDRLLGNLPQLSIGQISGSRDITFDDVFRHEHPRFSEMLAPGGAGFKRTRQAARSEEMPKIETKE
jgi:hypothetical protein